MTHLKDWNPDKAQFLLHGYPAGFSLGFVDPPAGKNKNRSCALAPIVIDDFISIERALGRTIRRF